MARRERRVGCMDCAEGPDRALELVNHDVATTGHYRELIRTLVAQDRNAGCGKITDITQVFQSLGFAVIDFNSPLRRSDDKTAAVDGDMRRLHIFRERHTLSANGRI